MSYAVLFKIYYYDDFVSRQLDRLKQQISDGDLYVWIDETRGRVEGIEHDKIIRTSEESLLTQGFVSGNSEHPMFWFSADYALQPALSQHPAYDYYVTIEYDAVINIALDPIVESMRERNIDFVGERILRSPEKWFWRKTCDRIYGGGSLRPYLNMIALYSKRAAVLLMRRRKEMGRQLSEGIIDQWPLSEAFIGTELANAGMALGSLSDYGDTTHLRWWPPHHESELRDLSKFAFVHPVLEGDRYIDSLLADGQIHNLFKPAAPATKRLGQAALETYVHKLLPKLLKQDQQDKNVFKDRALFQGTEPGPNIAYGRPCTQSSVSHWSRNATPSDDAGGAVNGLVTGSFGFHTGRGDPPWWSVDLEAAYWLDEIWIFNRLDMPGRARSLVLHVSSDGRNWSEIYRHDMSLFGGAFGGPLIVPGSTTHSARFVRIELAKGEYLHLDQVKVFGVPENVLGHPRKNE